MRLRGIRGAVRVAANESGEIVARTRELLEAVVKANRVRPDDIAAAFFTMTPDLDAAFPAAAARTLGWTHVPVIGAPETAVPGALDRVVRVLLLVHTNLAPGALRHQYLGETSSLRPDLAPRRGAVRRRGRTGGGKR